MSEAHASQTDKLIRMANQIAGAFAAMSPEEAVSMTAEHLVAFWTPKMRRTLIDHVAAGGAGLEPVSLAAAKSMAAR